LPGIENAVPLPLPGPIAVPTVLENPHRLVALSARYLQKARPKDGVVSAPKYSCLDIRVSLESLDRALRICDALIRAMETAGLVVKVVAVESTEPPPRHYHGSSDETPRPPQRSTRVLCDDEWITFSLTEKVRRVLDPGPAAPASGAQTWEPRAYTYEPTGELAIHVTNADNLGIRTKWQDGKRQRLEQMLESFVENLSTVALAFKIKRDDDEQRAVEAREAERRRCEEELRRYEEAARQREEKKKVEELEAEVARWKRAQDIRDYVEAAKRSLEAEGVAAEDAERTRDRLRWALKYADQIDPLRQPGHPAE
jgi:hypothetical protein